MKLSKTNRDVAKMEVQAPKAPIVSKTKPSIFVCIFNYNKNENALRWQNLLKKDFHVVIFDSGSDKPCPMAISYENIYYGGMFNEAIKKSTHYDWCCIITSDVLINDNNATRLIGMMKNVANMPAVGNYQPSCDVKGRSHSFGYNKRTGTLRTVPYMEGWFQMFRTKLGFNLPLDINRIGWGTDMYLCKKALAAKLVNVVDDTIVVFHPKESGFDNNIAKQQMDKWTTTLPDWENKIKIGMAINVFEGSEHISDIISEIRSLVDVVVVLFQKESYTGLSADEEDISQIKLLKEKGLVDDIVEFNRIPYMNAREQETIKRNQGMAYLETKGCDYSIIIDSDEFYDKSEFAGAKEYVRKYLPDATYCYYTNFYKDKQHILVDDCYNVQRGVPFLCRSGLRFKFNMRLNIPSDATRRIDSNGIMFLPKQAIQMYHLSWVRKDIHKKMRSWSSSAWFTDDEKKAMIKSWETFDGTQEYVTVPHKICNNKVKVVKINQ